MNEAGLKVWPNTDDRKDQVTMSNSAATKKP